MMMPERPIAAVLNHLLSRQPALCAMLVPHAGKFAHLYAGAICVALEVQADGLLQPAADAAPNVSIRINPAELPAMLADRDRAFAYVSLSGDAEFARTIAAVVQGLEWDAEEDLAPFVGDIAAVRIMQTARAMVGGMRTGSRKLIEQIAEYLLEENPTLLYRRAGEDFATQVAALRDDVERLGKRIGYLESRNRGVG